MSEKLSEKFEGTPASRGVVAEKLLRWKAETKDEKDGLLMVRELQKRGKTYFAGGYVRDMLLSREFKKPFKPKDIDIATELPPEESSAILESAGFETKFVGKSFGVFKAFRVDHGHALDVATFRVEEEYADGAHPDKVVLIRDPEKDAERRDFTINALFFDPVEGKVIDYVGGLKDIKERVLRPVGDPEKRFAEDYSRMLRYVRFRNQCELPFDRKVQDVIKRNAEKIMDIAPEKVRKELDAILKLPKNYLAVADMERLGLLQYVLPEMSALQEVMHPRSAPYHKEGSVFRHTLEALRSFGSKPYMARMREMLSLSEGMDPGDVRDRFFKRYGGEVPWAVLCHDLGKRTKQQTRTLPNGDTRTTFVGHELDSRDMVRDIAKRFNFSAERRDKIMWLVENHLIPRDFPKMKVSKARAFLQHPWIEELLFVSLADSMGSIPIRAEQMNRLFEMLQEERNRPPEPKELISGKILMEELELKPGKAIGRIKDAIREAQLEGKIKTPEEALEFARAFKKDMKEEAPEERRKK